MWFPVICAEIKFLFLFFKSLKRTADKESPTLTACLIAAGHNPAVPCSWVYTVQI